MDKYEFRLDAYYDGVLHSTFKYTNALDAVNSFNKCVDWGFANEYATYNLYEPSGKCHTRNYYRSGIVVGK